MDSRYKASIRSLVLLSALLALCLAFSSTGFALEIRVKKGAKIDGDTVYLGDIASFHPSDDIRVDKLKAIEITASPAPDTFRRVNRDLIIYKVASLLKAEKGITLTSPESIIIKRSAQIVSAETIKKIFRDYVHANAPWNSDQMVIEDINAPAPIALPKGKLDWEIDEKRNRNFIGNFSLLIDFKVDGDPQRKIIVTGKLSVTREVVKAVRDIDRGDIINAGDVVLISEKNSYFKRNIVTNTKEIVGKRATRRIQAAQQIQTGMFESPPAVEKGDRVVIKAENNELLITASGEALEEGSVGDQIRVMNISSGREIIATVKRTDLVEVQF